MIFFKSKIPPGSAGCTLRLSKNNIFTDSESEKKKNGLIDDLMKGLSHLNLESPVFMATAAAFSVRLLIIHDNLAALQNTPRGQ